MKRITALLLALLSTAVFALTGCGGKNGGEAFATEPVITTEQAFSTEHAISTERASVTEPAATEETKPTRSPAKDVFYVVPGGAIYSASSTDRLIETDDALYFANVLDTPGFYDPCFVYYSDKEYRDWMPLCGRPDCLHNDEDCNAYIGKRYTQIWLYGDHIYYKVEREVTLPEIWRMKLDGSDHELIFNDAPRILPDGIGGYSSGDSSCYLHDNKLFMTVHYAAHDDPDAPLDELAIVYRCFMLDLSDPTEATELVFTDERGESKNNLGFICAEGDKLYTVVTNVDRDERGMHSVSNSELFVYDLTELTYRKLCDLPVYMELPRLWINDGKLYCLGADGSEADLLVLPEEGGAYMDMYKGQTQMIVQVDAETGETEILGSALREEVVWNHVFSGHVIGTHYGIIDRDVEYGTYIYSLEGELEAFIPYEKYEKRINVYYIAGDLVLGYVVTNDPKDKATGQYPNYNPPAYYLDLSEIGTEDFNWHEWQP